MGRLKTKVKRIVAFSIAFLMAFTLMPGSLMGGKVFAETEYTNVSDQENGPIIATDKKVYEEGEPILVKLENWDEYTGKKPWVGIYDYDDYNASIGWLYPEGNLMDFVINDTSSSSGVTWQGTLPSSGHFYVAYVGDGWLAYVDVIVNPSTPLPDPIITTDKPSYAYGEDIIVTTDYNGSSMGWCLGWCISSRYHVIWNNSCMV